MLKRSRFSILLSFLAILILWPPRTSLATVRPPVVVQITSEDAVRPGKPMTVKVTLEGADLLDASFELLEARGEWNVVGGQARWQGSLKTGQPVTFEAVVVPHRRVPAPLRGRLSLPGWGDTEWAMDRSTLRPPASMTITTDEQLAVGKPMTIRVVLQGEDVPEAKFELFLPEAGWTLVRGEKHWKGSLRTGRAENLDFYLVPTEPDPEPVRGRLSIPGFGDIDGDVERPGSRKTSTAIQPASVPTTEAIGFGAGAIGIQDVAGVTASGRFVYTDDSGNTVGIRHAHVRLWDTDYFWGCIGTFGMCRSFMGETYTDDNGYFTMSGVGADPWFGDLPDPYVEVSAESEAAVVLTPSLPYATYCFKSGYYNNVANGSVIDFGTISPSATGGCSVEQDVRSENGAWQLYNNAREAWQFMRTYTLAHPGADVPQVRVFWPDGGTISAYNPYGTSGIGIVPVDTFNESVIMHEYGHFILGVFSESPSPDYSNGVCDTPEPGHCLCNWEKGAIHWTEGWPDFLSKVLTTFYRKNNVIADLETPCEGSPPYPNHSDTNFSMIEGITAGILWDQYDLASDNHDGNNSRDNLAQGFGPQWDVIVDYDPSPGDPWHNHPINIGEFWQGYATLYPDLANRLSEVYDESHITGKPAADLTVSAASTPTTSVLLGGWVVASDTTRNDGTVSTGVASTTRYYLSPDSVVTPSDFALLGGRNVPNLPASGGLSSGSLYVRVPGNVPPGLYTFGACADGPGQVFESNDLNNCFASISQVRVMAPDLIETAVTDPPAAIVQFDSFTVTDTLANVGDGAAGNAMTRFYLSRDTVKNAGDFLLDGTRLTTGLAGPTGTSSGATTVTLFGSPEPAPYYLLACADDTFLVLESDESNNCIASSQRVYVNAADLVAEGVSDPPASALVGSSLTISDTLRNRGTIATGGASTNHYYLSTNTIKDSGDLPLDGSRAVPDLAAFAWNSGSATVTIPATTPPGSYFLLACANDPPVVREWNYGNNCRASGRRMEIGPDLVTTSVTSPPSSGIAGYTVFNVAHTILNRGTVGVGASSTRFYLAMPSSSARFQVGEIPMPSLAPTSSASATTSAYVPLATPGGTYYLLACADGAAAIAESYETNNCLTSSTTITITSLF